MAKTKTKNYVPSSLYRELENAAKKKGQGIERVFSPGLWLLTKKEHVQSCQKRTRT